MSTRDSVIQSRRYASRRKCASFAMLVPFDVTRKTGKAVGLEVFQEIDAQLADEELVLAVRESFSLPRSSLYCASVLGFTSSRESR